MSRKSRRRRVKSTQKIRKSEGNSLYLIPISLNETFLGFRLKNTNQLWDWRTLEDVNFK